MGDADIRGGPPVQGVRREALARLASRPRLARGLMDHPRLLTLDLGMEGTLGRFLIERHPKLGMLALDDPLAGLRAGQGERLVHVAVEEVAVARALLLEGGPVGERLDESGESARLRAARDHGLGELVAELGSEEEKRQVAEQVLNTLIEAGDRARARKILAEGLAVADVVLPRRSLVSALGCEDGRVRELAVRHLAGPAASGGGQQL